MKNTNKYPYFWAVIYGFLLTGYVVFALLDAFIIPRDIVAMNDVNLNGVNSIYFESYESTENEDDNIVVTDNSYISKDISISISEMRLHDSQIYIADVQISNIAYLKTAVANNTFGRNILAKTSEMAEEHNAIFAVSGDYYGFRDAGFVMRNGYLYRGTPRDSYYDDAFVVYDDGDTEIVDEMLTDADELVSKGAVHIFTFGPAIIRDGEIAITGNEDWTLIYEPNPRCAFGMIEPLHYLFVVVEGRSNQNTGLTLMEMAELMMEYNCVEAYNLDGGGSATMYFMGKLINNPTADGVEYGERNISDIVYIGY